MGSSSEMNGVLWGLFPEPSGCRRAIEPSPYSVILQELSHASNTATIPLESVLFAHHHPSDDEPRGRLPVLKDEWIADRFGKRLRSLRLEHNRTQTELAKHLGIDRSFISDLERGKKTATLSYLETIAQGFNLTLTELMTGV